MISNLIMQVLLAQEATAEAPDDFRAHVWFAYALVLVLLGVFTLWTLLKLTKLEGRYAHLVERFEKKHPEEREA